MAEYKLTELAEVTGISERTIRYYISEGLLPALVREGRSTIYDDNHLEALKKIKSLQAMGRSLQEIRTEMVTGTALADLPGAELWETFNLALDVRVSLLTPLTPYRRHQITQWLQSFPRG